MQHEHAGIQAPPDRLELRAVGALLPLQLRRQRAQLVTVVIGLDDREVVATLPLSGQPDAVAVAPSSAYAAIAIENARLVEDLRRSREQVRRADRLGTLGTLAAGLAHEINNPLTSVIGNAQLIRADVEPGSELAEGMDDIIASAQRVAEVVDALSAATRLSRRPSSNSPIR